jgi:hypothetical protein
MPVYFVIVRGVNMSVVTWSLLQGRRRGTGGRNRCAALDDLRKPPGLLGAIIVLLLARPGNALFFADWF